MIKKNTKQEPLHPDLVQVREDSNYNQSVYTDALEELLKRSSELAADITELRLIIKRKDALKSACTEEIALLCDNISEHDRLEVQRRVGDILKRLK
tara:strand:+ start:310 stop:597 length:288 start_codon:yes stop_codon:yes gene_type:complete